MKGLIIKDLKLTRNQSGTLLILSVVIAVFLAISGIGDEFATGYITIIFSTFAATTVSYDEYENGFPFLLSLPISRKEYVNAKYVFSGILVLAAWIIGAVFGMLLRGVKGEEIFASDKLAATLGYLTVSVVFVAVLLPLRLKYEGDKSRHILPLVIGGTAIFVWGIVKLTEMAGIDAAGKTVQVLNNMGTAGILGILAAVVLFSTVISWQCSSYIMMNKEF